MSEKQILHNFMFDIQRWHTSDALKVLSFEAANFYLRLLVDCHETGEIPSDPVKLAAHFGTTADQISQLLEEVRPWFNIQQREVGRGGKVYTYLTNENVNEVRTEAIKKIEDSRINGRKGGRPKQGESEEPRPNPGVNPGFPTKEPRPNPTPKLNRTEQNRSEQNRTEAATANPSAPSDSNRSTAAAAAKARFPKSWALIYDTFPGSNEQAGIAIVSVAQKQLPQLLDDQLLNCLLKTLRPKQQSPMLWVETVGSYLQNKQATLASIRQTVCQTCFGERMVWRQDIVNMDDPHWMDALLALPEEEQKTPCPDCCSPVSKPELPDKLGPQLARVREVA